MQEYAHCPLSGTTPESQYGGGKCGLSETWGARLCSTMPWDSRKETLRCERRAERASKRAAERANTRAEAASNQAHSLDRCSVKIARLWILPQDNQCCSTHPSHSSWCNAASWNVPTPALRTHKTSDGSSAPTQITVRRSSFSINVKLSSVGWAER